MANDMESPAGPVVTVTPVELADLPLLEGLFQFYIYDFSEMEPPGSTQFEVDALGRFDPYPGLDDYWTLDGFHPLLIRAGGQAAGFALVNTRSHRDDGQVERNMGEFFVLRKHRRSGIATRAVAEVLRLYPGRWEIAVVARNAAAQAFWPRAIAAAPGVTDFVQVEGDGQHWRGPIWCFEADPAD